MSLLDQFATELLAADPADAADAAARAARLPHPAHPTAARHAKELRDLIVTMILSFPSLLNVASLLALIIFIYAVLGVRPVHLPRARRPWLHPRRHQRQRNFVTFGNAFCCSSSASRATAGAR